MYSLQLDEFMAGAQLEMEKKAFAGANFLRQRATGMFKAPKVQPKYGPLPKPTAPTISTTGTAAQPTVVQGAAQPKGFAASHPWLTAGGATVGMTGAAFASPMYDSIKENGFHPIDAVTNYAGKQVKSWTDSAVGGVLNSALPYMAAMGLGNGGGQPAHQMGMSGGGDGGTAAMLGKLYNDWKYPAIKRVGSLKTQSGEL